MRLYHGGAMVVEQPRILMPEPGRTVDFGYGFYTTTDYEQAVRWSRLRQKHHHGNAHVSVFEAPDDLPNLSELRVLSFAAPTRAWLDFVMQNRNKASFQHDYDVVVGPVADDRVYATLSLFESELLDADETIRRLKTYTLVNQFLFHTEKALRYLVFVEGKSV